MCMGVADMDHGQVDMGEGPAVGTGGDALPPVRGARHRRVSQGLHVRAPGGHEAASGGREGAAHLRDQHGALRRARMPCRRPHPRPRGLDAPRGGRHRGQPHRRGVGGRNQTWPPSHCVR